MLGRRELVKMGHFACVRCIYGTGILSNVFVRALSWCISVCAWELSSFTQIIFKLSTLLAIQKKPINYNWNKCFLIRLLCDWWHTLSFSPRFVYFSWNYRHFLCKVSFPHWIDCGFCFRNFACLSPDFIFRPTVFAKRKILNEHSEKWDKNSVKWGEKEETILVRLSVPDGRVLKKWSIAAFDLANFYVIE